LPEEITSGAAAVGDRNNVPQGNPAVRGVELAELKRVDRFRGGRTSLV
jgi:hypothetical protein